MNNLSLRERWMYYAGILAAFGTNVDINDLKYIQDLLETEEQGLLHKAPLKDGTPIWYVLNIFDEVMYVTHTTYIFGITEYEIGEFGKIFG